MKNPFLFLGLLSLFLPVVDWLQKTVKDPDKLIDHYMKHQV